MKEVCINENIFIINGGHGSGKTTLIKNLIKHLNNEYKEIKTIHGFYTKAENICIIGKVSGKVTGGDSVGYGNIIKVLIYILENEENIKNIIIESPFFSKNFSSPLKWLIYVKLHYKINLINILLKISNKKLLERIKTRQNKNNCDLIKLINTTQKELINSYLKKYKLNIFENIQINIENNQESDTLKEFINIINMYNS